MIVKLDKDFVIDIDDLNHTLKQRYKVKGKDGTKRDGEKVIGYYPDMEACVEAYLDARRYRSTDDRAITLREYVNLVKRSNKEAVQAIKSVIADREGENE